MQRKSEIDKQRERYSYEERERGQEQREKDGYIERERDRQIEKREREIAHPQQSHDDMTQIVS